MSNILGVDPGKTIADSYGVHLCNGDMDNTGNIDFDNHGEYVTLIGIEYHYTFTPDIAIIEWPYTIPKMGGPDIDACIRTAAIIADRLTQMHIAVYIPPRRVILQQLGRKPFTKGNQDKWLNDCLKQMGHKTGRNTLLNSTHARAAFSACLFNYKHPDNQQYKYTLEAT